MTYNRSQCSKPSQLYTADRPRPREREQWTTYRSRSPGCSQFLEQKSIIASVASTCLEHWTCTARLSYSPGKKTLPSLRQTKGTRIYDPQNFGNNATDVKLISCCTVWLTLRPDSRTNCQNWLAKSLPCRQKHEQNTRISLSECANCLTNLRAVDPRQVKIREPLYTYHANPQSSRKHKLEGRK
jgi:hypothetical protein